ncbi:MAG: nucleotidyltransferase domain-containing protein [Defluviitaleaceae bacterium]|nr:nucleotidyltransferase domain-containing protein [Defluviitaleaceae bacterium]
MNNFSPSLISVTEVLRRNTQSLMGDKLRKIILYGSYARGDFREFSDLDIMVLADVSEAEKKEYQHRMYDMTSDLGLEHDIIVSMILNDENLFMSRLPISPFYRNVLSEGVELYAAR